MLLEDKKRNRYEYFLRSLGYNNDREELHELPLQVSNDEDIVRPIVARKNIKGKLWYIYNCLILMLITWKIPYIIYRAAITEDLNTGGLAAFPVLIVIQYGLGIKYFNRENFYKKMRDRDVKNTFNVYLIVSSIVALIFTVVSLALLVNDIDVYLYTNIYVNQTDTRKGGIATVLFLDLLYSNQIIAVNFCSFVATLIFHRRDATELQKKIEQNIENSSSSDDKIGKIAQDYTKSKKMFSDNIDETKYIFSSLVFLGFVHVTFLLNMLTNQTYYVLHITYAIIFIVVSVIFVNVIQTVKVSVGDIDGLISGKPFTNTYFSDDSEDPEIMLPHKDDTTADINAKILHNQYVNALKTDKLNKNMDWIDLKTMTKEGWDSYVVMGITIDDTTIITKIIGFIAVVILGTELVGLIEYW